jgi:dTDP-4-amino-4,6-dideoxygalactose transaminase
MSVQDDLRSVSFLDLAPTTAAVQSEVMDRWSEIMDTGAFVGGAAVSSFEERWARYCGVRHAVGVANGTDALELTFRALGLGAGDEVLVPANSFVATAEAVVLAGARPRFVDVDARTLLMDAETVRDAVTPRTRAIVVVHLYGHMPDMDALCMVARDHDLFVVEDAAQAHGARWQARAAGSWGTTGCFSFYPGKNLGAFGDAGAIVTDDDLLAELARSLRDHGRSAGSHYEHAHLGVNSRLDAVQAAVLEAKLRLLDDWNDERRSLWSLYDEVLDPEVVSLVTPLDGCSAVHHLAVIRVLDRNEVRRQLSTVGIKTSAHYPVPIHRMAPFRRYADRPLPNVERAAAEVMSLPLYPGLPPEHVEYVCDRLHRVLRGG